MWSIELEKFSEFGELGDLCLKMNRNEVVNTVGEPTDWGGDKHHKHSSSAPIWKYGSVQIWFDDDQVSFIGIYYSYGFDLPFSYNKYSNRFPKEDTSLADLVRYLHANSIEYQIDPELTFPNQIALLIGRQQSSITCQALFDSDTFRLASTHWLK